jgi:hypothetical protein
MHRKLVTFMQLVLLLTLGVFAGAWAGGTWPIFPTTSAGAQELDVKQAAPLAPAGTGFTYQGRLTDGGNPANGAYDFIFGLYDAATAGNQLGGSLNYFAQTVTNGLFTVALDFPPSAYKGEARWLAISVRQAGSGQYVTLTPRQPLTAAPYALNAPWDGIYNKPLGFNPARPPHNVTIVDDDSADVGEYSSVAIGVDGLPLISYWDKTNNDLKVTHCSNLQCTQATTTIVDNTTFVGKYSSIAIGRDGFGLIAYQNIDSGRLKVAHCTNIECSQATLSTLTAVDTAEYISLTIGSDGNGLISFHDGIDNDLMVAHCNDLLCSNATITLPTLANGNGTDDGEYSAITVKMDGFGFIAFRSNSGQVYLARCNNLNCTNPSVTIIGGSGVTDIAVASGPDGLIWVSYVTAGNLSLGRCSATNCYYLEQPVENNVKYTSIAVGSNGLPVISFYDDDTDDLKLMAFHDVMLAQSFPFYLQAEYQSTTLDSANNTGLYSSVVIGADDRPFITYHNETGGDLRVIHCSHPACIPYNRGR